MRETETGRSMVEMLGVLAIMGVLSIGGIAGYTYAMNKLRANNTVTYVNMLAIAGSQQATLGRDELTLGDFPAQTADGYDADIGFVDGRDGYFTIDISGVPGTVCRHIWNMREGWRVINDMGVYDVADTENPCTDETVDMWFEVSNTLGAGAEQRSCQSDNDCAPWLGTAYKCNTAKGKCEVSCGSNQVYTPWGCCDKNKVFNGGCCPGTIQEVDGVKKCCSGERCCPEGYLYYKKACVSCDSPEAINMVREGGLGPSYCKVCPDRQMESGQWLCAPDRECPEPMQKVQNECRCPMEHPIPNHNTNECMDCSDTRTGAYASAIGMNHDAANTGHYCNRRNGGAYSNYCAPGTVGVSWQDVIRRKVNGEWTNFTGPNYGECVPCEEVDVSALKYQAQCESCGGSWNGSSWDSGQCQP